MNCFKDFLRSESGAITVDWVVMTAGIVALGLAVTVIVSGGVEDVSSEVETHLASIDPGTLYDGFGSFAAAFGNLDLVNTMGLDQQHYENWARTGDGSGLGDPRTDDALIAQYNELYGSITSGGDWYHGDGVDALGAVEAEMASRGLDIPEGNQTYEDIHAEFTA